MTMHIIDLTDKDEELIRLRTRRVLDEARDAGLLGPRKDARISGRISTTLLNAAGRSTLLSSDTELIALALSRLVLEDDFGRRFVRRKGRVSRKLDLEF